MCDHHRLIKRDVKCRLPCVSEDTKQSCEVFWRSDGNPKEYASTGCPAKQRYRVCPVLRAQETTKQCIELQMEWDKQGQEASMAKDINEVIAKYTPAAIKALAKKIADEDDALSMDDWDDASFEMMDIKLQFTVSLDFDTSCRTECYIAGKPQNNKLYKCMGVYHQQLANVDCLDSEVTGTANACKFVRPKTLPTFADAFKEKGKGAGAHRGLDANIMERRQEYEYEYEFAQAGDEASVEYHAYHAFLLDFYRETMQERQQRQHRRQRRQHRHRRHGRHRHRHYQ